MITLNTPDDALLQELWSDYDKADYWLTKKLGGIKKQEELGNQQARQCMLSGKDFMVSDYVEYISPKGNRWLCAVETRKCDVGYYSTPLCFCYYETYGSVGAFLPVHREGTGVQCCTIFTSHFFLRLCDRLGLKCRSREMVARFFELIVGMLMSSSEDYSGKLKVDVAFPGSIGRGVYRDKDMRIAEIRTFLKVTELNRKQLRETKHVRTASSKIKWMREDVAQKMLNAGMVDKVYANKRNNYIAAGGNEAYFDKAEQFMCNVAVVGTKLGLPVLQTNLVPFVNDDNNGDKIIESAILAALSDGNNSPEVIEKWYRAVYKTLCYIKPTLEWAEFVDATVDVFEEVKNMK